MDIETAREYCLSKKAVTECFPFDEYSLVMKVMDLKSATPFPKCYLHKEKWTFDS